MSSSTRRVHNSPPSLSQLVRNRQKHTGIKNHDSIHAYRKRRFSTRILKSLRSRDVTWRYFDQDECLAYEAYEPKDREEPADVFVIGVDGLDSAEEEEGGTADCESAKS
jgi:hypothetical protein